MRKPVVTTGSFDGVHIGHKAILRRLRKLAGENGGESLLITFHPHPRKVLYPDTLGKDLKLIYTQKEKIRMLEQTGLDNLLIIPFTLDFSRLTSIEFIRKILVERLKANKVVVGYNHHFGHQREGSFEYLYELGRYYAFGVEEIPEQDLENEAVSSTRIRKALKEGQIQRANAYLDHLFLMMGRPSPSPYPGIPGHTEFILKPEEAEKLVPPPGTYACGIEWKDREQKALAVIPSTADQVRVVVPGTLDGYSAQEDLTLYFRKNLRNVEREHSDAWMDGISGDIQLMNELIY